MENTKSSLIAAFFEKQPVGDCTDNKFEFGNLHRKTIECSFCINNKCQYRDDCDRRKSYEK